MGGSHSPPLSPTGFSREPHILGIHGDPLAAQERIAQATRDGVRLGKEAYGYSRAFSYTPDEGEAQWIRDQIRSGGLAETPSVLDPTAGGGSIPFETVRLGLNSIANDLNPVAWLILKATVEFPAKYGRRLLERYRQIGEEFRKRACERLARYYPNEPEPDCVPDGYLWARTIACPYCGGIVPLSPNWRLDAKGTGVRIVPQVESAGKRHKGKAAPAQRCSFEIVTKLKDHSPGTVNKGAALCPFPDCGRVIAGDEIKAQAQAGRMGQQLYAVVFKREVIVGRTKKGNPKTKKIRGFRAPRPEDDVEAQVRAAVESKMPEWKARNIVPDEEFPDNTNDDRPRQYGMPLWRDMFSPRQLYGHCTSVEVFQDLFEELRAQSGGELSELDKAAMVYLCLAMDKMLNYNSRMSVWMSTREVVANTFNRHDFAFCWSFAEMAPTITGLGYDWAIKQTGKALKELIGLVGDGSDSEADLFSHASDEGGEKAGSDSVEEASASYGSVHASSPDGERAERVSILHGSADALAVPDGSVDAIIIDPPYYDNVMYAELADFFYVWLKRTAGLLYPEAFMDYLTDKDREAVANPAKFKAQGKARAGLDNAGGTPALPSPKGKARQRAGLDYQERMGAIFRECRRVLKPGGAMTVMFTHKASSAWDALATGLVRAGFTITASWPINTEAGGSLHIKDKSAARSTIFLVCRPREGSEEPPEGGTLNGTTNVYWEDLEPKVVEAVRRRIGEFQAAGIRGVDLYLACFGPALQVFSEAWPLTRGKPQPKPAWMEDDLVAQFFGEWDPYAVRPEDALDAARREVKRWRMEQLATVKRQHHLDPLTEWFILAWDAFGAPRFPSDEALKLARVVGLDFDDAAKGAVCEVKGSDVILWDSRTRKAKGRLGTPGPEVMLDTLHQAAVIGREHNTGAARTMLEKTNLIDDATLMTALEALLNVLPPLGGAAAGKKDDILAGASSDFEALEKLRRLAFSETVPEPKQTQLLLFESGQKDDTN